MGFNKPSNQISFKINKNLFSYSNSRQNDQIKGIPENEYMSKRNIVLLLFFINLYKKKFIFFKTAGKNKKL